jgi:large subunit ribosomal protein L23
MNEERLMKVLLSPVVSEKSAGIADANRQYTFRVAIDASKPEIARAVELLFDVNVEDVQVVRMKGKTKRFGRFTGKRKDWKKAYVRIREGQDIQFAGGA